MKKFNICLSIYTLSILFILPICILAGLAPRQDYWSDTSQRPIKRSLIFNQAGSQDLGWQFRTNSTGAQNISNATSVVFYFTPTDRSWTAATTGTVESAVLGKILVSFNPADLNTNGIFDFRLEVSDGSTMLAYVYGELCLIEDITASGAPALTTVTNINWIDYLYQNTASAGPVRPDNSTITSVTNPDGSITLSTTGIVSIVIEGDGVIVLTNGVEYTVSVDGTVMRSDGSVPATGPLDMGGFAIIGIGTNSLTFIDGTSISSADYNSLTNLSDNALHFHSSDRARANHTGTQLAATVSDFQKAVSNNVLVANAIQPTDPVFDGNPITITNTATATAEYLHIRHPNYSWDFEGIVTAGITNLLWRCNTTALIPFGMYANGTSRSLYDHAVSQKIGKRNGTGDGVGDVNIDFTDAANIVVNLNGGSFTLVSGTNRYDIYFNTTSNRLAMDSIYGGTTNATTFLEPAR